MIDCTIWDDTADKRQRLIIYVSRASTVFGITLVRFSWWWKCDDVRSCLWRRPAINETLMYGSGLKKTPRWRFVACRSESLRKEIRSIFLDPLTIDFDRQGSSDVLDGGNMIVFMYQRYQRGLSTNFTADGIVILKSNSITSKEEGQDRTRSESMSRYSQFTSLLIDVWVQCQWYCPIVKLFEFV